MPFTCNICGEESTRICARCTKDACDNHLCEKCLKCSDCCECEVKLVRTRAPLVPRRSRRHRSPPEFPTPNPIPNRPCPDRIRTPIPIPRRPPKIPPPSSREVGRADPQVRAGSWTLCFLLSYPAAGAAP